MESDKKKDTVCPHCGQQTLEHRHGLNMGIVRAMAAVYAKNGTEPFHMSSQGLELSQMLNFAKLQYWGLVGQHVTDKTRHKRGWWRVTRQGVEFVMGRIAIHRWVKTFNREVKGFEGEYLHIYEVIQDYQYRGDYVESAVPATPEVDREGQIAIQDIGLAGDGGQAGR